jgi:hypothetical protein
VIHSFLCDKIYARVVSKVSLKFNLPHYKTFLLTTTDTEDGHKWVRNVILIVWKYIKIRWEERCEIAHEETPKNLKEKNEAANSKLEEIYKKINEVGVED